MLPNNNILTNLKHGFCLQVKTRINSTSLILNWQTLKEKNTTNLTTVTKETLVLFATIYTAVVAKFRSPKSRSNT